MTQYEKLSAIAEIAHESNRIFCVHVGDPAITPWEKCTDDQKASILDGVKYLASNPGKEDNDVHANWKAFKEKSGWTYGKVKDEVKKTHPDLVPWESLAPSQKAKSAMFVNLFRAVNRYLL